jgi:hypothetical protein
MNSELAKVMRQEQEEAEPAMPKCLVPIYAHGNGDYYCIEAETNAVVEWNHETGTWESAVLTSGFAGLVADTESK